MCLVELSSNLFNLNFSQNFFKFCWKLFKFNSQNFSKFVQISLNFFQNRLQNLFQNFLKFLSIFCKISHFLIFLFCTFFSGSYKKVRPGDIPSPYFPPHSLPLFFLDYLYSRLFMSLSCNKSKRFFCVNVEITTK